MVGLVRDYGLLHEAEMLPRSYGGYSWFGKFHPAAGKELLSSLPAIVRALLRRKVNPRQAIFGHKLRREDLKSVQAIYDRVESREQRYELNLYITGSDEGEEAPTVAATGAGAHSAPGPEGTTNPSAGEGGAS
jgi:succinate dehydrogenase / fumarate reductase iron-sulfur subunit